MAAMAFVVHAALQQQMVRNEDAQNSKSMLLPEHVERVGVG